MSTPLNIVKFYYDAPTRTMEYSISGLDAAPNALLYPNIQRAFEEGRTFRTTVQATQQVAYHNLQNCAAIEGIVPHSILKSGKLKEITIHFSNCCPSLYIAVSEERLAEVSSIIERDLSSAKPKMLYISDGYAKTILFNTSKVAFIEERSL